MAPSIDLFYQFLGGGKPAEAKGELEQMLEDDDALDFNPNDV
jgi:hypothetical protein